MKNRSEQTRILTKKMVAWTAVVLAAFTLVFCLVAVALNRAVMPALGNAVANAVSPWEYMSALDVMGYTEGNSTLVQKTNEVKADVVRNYLNALADEIVSDADLGLTVADESDESDGASQDDAVSADASAGSSAPADSELMQAIRAINAGELDYSDVTDKVNENASDISKALSSYTEQLKEYNPRQYALPADTRAAYLVAIARDSDYADARSQGLTTSDAVSGPEADSQFAGASDSMVKFVKLAVDLRNAGAAANVHDGIWLLTKGLYANSAIDSYYAEAADPMHADISQKIVYSTIGLGNEQEVVIYADGHGVTRDLSAYDQVKQLKLPVALILYLLGCLVIMVFAVRKSLGYFDTLFASVGAILSKRGSSEDAAELPPELSIAQKTIDDIRLRNDLDERAAEAAERRKNELVAYLAHDTKTPLTSITGYLSLLEEAPDMPESQRKRYASTALQKAYRLDGMLDEFFEITRYNLHAIAIEREHFDPALLCFQVAEEFYPEASSRGIEIRVDAQEGDEVFADARKLSRALSNVVKNAVAYADANSVIDVKMCLEQQTAAKAKASAKSEASTQAGASAEKERGRTLRISVTNRGREISREHLDRIFDKFYREDDARATNQGGAGLGLAIAREIVQAHGGAIGATSEGGRTVFTLEIPAGE